MRIAYISKDKTIIFLLEVFVQISNQSYRMAWRGGGGVGYFDKNYFCGVT